jgi:hypothetical protein
VGIGKNQYRKTYNFIHGTYSWPLFCYISMLGYNTRWSLQPSPAPSICHKSMAVKWHCELSRRRAPLTGNLLSLLPQQRFEFTTALREGCVAHWWRASVAALQTIVPPPPPPLWNSVFAPSLLSSLDSHHRPVIAPQPPTVTVVRWHAFIALRCLLSSATVVLCHILHYSLVCRHGLLLLCRRVQQRSSTATQLFSLHRCPLLTATAILCTVVLFLLIIHRLIGACWLSFHCCSSRWRHRRSGGGGVTTVWGAAAEARHQT